MAPKFDYDLIVSHNFPVKTVTYTERDSVLYNLGIGACGRDAVDSDELKYTHHQNGLSRFCVEKALFELSQNMSRQSLVMLQRVANSPALSLSRIRQAHAYVVKTGVCSNDHVATRLVSLYANLRCFDDANLVVNSVSNPSMFLFSTLIYAFTKVNHFGNAIHVFRQMVFQGIEIDSHVLPSVVKACAGLSNLMAGKQVHGFIYVSGFNSDSMVLSSLVHFYLKWDLLRDARNVFDKMLEPNVVAVGALLVSNARKGCVKETKDIFCRMKDSNVEPNSVLWNGMIAGFNQSGYHLEAVNIFREMHLEGFKPDCMSVSSVLPAIGDMEMLVFGIQVHGLIIKEGLGQERFVVSALIDMYGKCASMSNMSKVLEEMDEEDIGACNALITGLSRNGLVDNALDAFIQFNTKGMSLNVVSWTSIIASCSQNGKDIEALDLFREMQMAEIKPNSVTIACLLPACGNIAALMHGKSAHCFSLKNGISNDVHVGGALIDMYSKCGRIEASRRCFDKMPTKNLVCWNALIGGYAMHGKSKEAIEIFELMQKSGQKPDFISFTCVLSACSQSGLTDYGWSFFNKMSTEHGIEPRMEHYAYMVTLLGRAGKLEDAYSMIMKMPFEPDACVWGALLSSCRVHKNVKLGETAAKKLFELEPQNPGNYILLSNIYASKAMWVEVDAVRDMMKSKGLRKNPGRSWIELKNKMHVVLAGDKSHPQMAQIVEKLAKLNIEMKKSGYFPCTDFVLQDVEEQDKEQILCAHSEKLAVVIGLLNTSPGSPLRIIKNLRICSDCHSVMKFISSFEQREIFVRDTNRFHHFKDNVCSCGDYW